MHLQCIKIVINKVHLTALLTPIKSVQSVVWGRKPQVGNYPLSPLFCTGQFLEDVPYWPHNYSLEKNKVPRELALIAISLACLVAQWYSYSGSWKWVTILPILIGILQLLFAICFCIPSYVHQQLLSLDCQNFVHHNSLVFFTYLMNPYRADFRFWRGPTVFNYLRRQFVKVHEH